MCLLRELINRMLLRLALVLGALSVVVFYPCGSMVYPCSVVTWNHPFCCLHKITLKLGETHVDLGSVTAGEGQLRRCSRPCGRQHGSMVASSRRQVPVGRAKWNPSCPAVVVFLDLMKWLLKACFDYLPTRWLLGPLKAFIF